MGNPSLSATIIRRHAAVFAVIICFASSGYCSDSDSSSEVNGIGQTRGKLLQEDGHGFQAPPPSHAVTGTNFDYSVSGEVQSYYPKELGFSQIPSIYDFTLKVSPPRWSIRIIPKQETPHPHLAQTDTQSTADYMEASSDGAMFYYVISTASTKKANPKVINRGQGFQAPGDVPFGACNDEILCLWYLYASETYFAKIKSNRIHPLWRMPLERFKSSEILQPATWVISPDRPSLPSMIATTETKQQKDSGSQQICTNALLTVTSRTNAHGLSLPKTAEVSFSVCFIRPQPFINKTLLISASEVAVAAKGDEYVPCLPSPSIVTRVASNKELFAVSTLATNWLDEKKASRLYQEHKLSQSAKKTSSDRDAKVLKWILSAAVIVPGLFIAFRSINKNKRNG